MVRAVAQTFRPEFQNRLDKVIVFRPLTRDLISSSSPSRPMSGVSGHGRGGTACVGRDSGRGVARFGLYESTVFTWYPELRRAVREAGWNYDPAKP